MTYHHTKYTNQLLIYGLLVILGFVLGCNLSCNSNQKGGQVKPVIIKVKDSTTTKPQPVNIEVIEAGRIPELAASKPYIVHKWDTLWIYEHGEVDTLEILKDYFAKYMYADTLKTKYGNITVWDTVTMNKIAGRKFLADLTIPSEIQYITKEPKKRNEVYFSMGGLYNQSALSIGGGLLLKTKRDRFFGVNAYLGTDGQLTYNFQTAFKISFRK